MFRSTWSKVRLYRGKHNQELILVFRSTWSKGRLYRGKHNQELIPCVQEHIVAKPDYIEVIAIRS